ncbi:MAG TPA: phospholipid scramblase-related protein [Actinomycetota bacterium]|nr:phospholipid scramblase-related protein [Actinomycetota bacterium]
MASLLDAPRLVVSQKSKLIEMTNQYLIRDPEGAELGRVEQEGQSKLKKIVRFIGDVDQFMTHTLSVYEADGTKVLELTRPRKVFKSRLLVKSGDGREVGQIVQENVFGKIRFKLEGSQGQELGKVKAENWRAWDFSIVDATDHEIGRIDKKFVGIAKALFTTGDNYVVDIGPEAQGDLRLMAVAASVAVDTALKQDDKGLSVTDLLNN